MVKWKVSVVYFYAEFIFLEMKLFHTRVCQIGKIGELAH